MAHDLESLITRLDANLPREVQEQAIREAVDRGVKKQLDLALLCQQGPKALWENQARALLAIGFPGLEPVLPLLFAWLQDLNWPGAQRILGFLEEAPQRAIQKALEAALQQARKESDDEWLDSLERLRERRTASLR